MNHKPRKWDAQFRTAHDLVPHTRMNKWPDVDCKHQLVRSTARNKRLAAQAMRIPRNTQVRLARSMMVNSNRYPN